MDKSEFIKRLRELVADGRTEDALDLLSDNISDFAAYFANDVIMLKSQYLAAKNQFLLQGIMDNSEYSRITAKVSMAILEIASKIEKETEQQESPRKGHLLNKIPSKMVQNKETKCIIRIAYSLEKLYIGLTIDEDTNIQIVQVTGLMSVELIDDNEDKTFEIRTSTDEEQFIIQDDYTQWIYKVRPLKIGNFPLTLKIAAIEIINGKERKRNIIVEKEVKIIVDGAESQENPFQVINVENIQDFVRIKDAQMKAIKEYQAPTPEAEASRGVQASQANTSSQPKAIPTQAQPTVPKSESKLDYTSIIVMIVTTILTLIYLKCCE